MSISNFNKKASKIWIKIFKSNFSGNWKCRNFVNVYITTKHFTVGEFQLSELVNYFNDSSVRLRKLWMRSKPQSFRKASNWHTNFVCKSLGHQIVWPLLLQVNLSFGRSWIILICSGFHNWVPGVGSI